VDGSGTGVVYKTTPCDYAEYLPRLHPDEPIESGDIVGVFGGSVTRETAGAPSVAAVSTAPAFLGNMPSKGSEGRYEMIAFLGQVPVKVRGPVRGGDFILPSGQNDGVGVAMSSGEIAPEQVAQIVGQAWESSDDCGVKKVNALVGISPASKGIGRLAELIQRQEERIRRLEERLGAIAPTNALPTVEAHTSLLVPALVAALLVVTAIQLRSGGNGRKAGVQ
jgi:hypothetical protein